MNRATRVALIGLIIGAVLSGALFFNLHANENRRLQALFESQAEILTLAIQQETDQQVELIESLSAFFNASNMVTREAFRAFNAVHLAHDEAIQALEWVPRVRHEDRAVWMAAAEDDGLVDFDIRERDENGLLVPASERVQYFPVFFVEPMEGNEYALGYDLASEPDRLAALELSASTGSPVATAPIILIQESGEQASFLIFWPIYNDPDLGHREDNLSGFTLGVFRAGDLLNSAIGELDIQSQAFLTIKDLGSGNELYRSPGETPSPIGFTSDGNLELATRNWQIEFQSTPAFEIANRSNTSWVVLVGGLLFSGLVSLYFYQQANRTQIVEQLVDQRTNQLSEALNQLQAESRQRAQAVRDLTLSEGRLQQIQQIAQLGTWETDIESGKSSWWGQMFTIYGIEPQDFSGSFNDYVSWIHPEDRSRVTAHQKAVLRRSQALSTFHDEPAKLPVQAPIDFRIIRPDQSICYVLSDSVALADPSGKAAQIRGYLIDISEIKRIEAAEREQRALAESLWKTAEVLNSSLEFEEVLVSILNGLRAVLVYDSANIMLVEDGVAKLIGTQAYEAEMVETSQEFQLTDFYFFQPVLATRQPVLVTDTQAESNWQEIKGLEWIRSSAFEPILSKGSVIGLLNVDSRSVSAFRTEDLRRLQAFATQASIALENAGLH